MIANEGLIKKIYLPKIIFPLSVSIALLIDAIYAFIALFMIMVLLGADLSYSLITIPLAYLLLFSFSLGIGLILSVYSVFLRDVQHITPIIIQALFFLSPILYPSDRFASGPLGFIINFTPIVPFIDLFRNPLYHSSFPSLETYALASFFSITSLLIGFYVMERYKREISFKL
jgi:ABC-type polysaccharide/polyol phosphate export permease